MMSFKEWKTWYKHLSWTRKWFVIFILIRPIVDGFYTLKEKSPLLSPLYIIGVLTPILAILSLSSPKFRKHRYINGTYILFAIFGFFIFFNALILSISTNSIVRGLSIFLKGFNPIILFIYTFYFIRSKEDMHGILKTFLYSSLILLGLLYFEAFIHPIRPEYLSKGRGGGIRLRGFYADIMNYCIGIIGYFLYSSYQYLINIYGKSKNLISLQKLNIKLIISILICMPALFGVKHTATWGVFLALSVLLILYASHKLKNFTLIFFIILMGPIAINIVYGTYIEPLIKKEINVIEGESDVDTSFNGRMARWKYYLGIWNDMPLRSKILGVSTSNSNYAYAMTSGGMHNDYIRLMFSSGIIGLIFYLLFYISLFSKTSYLSPPERFLAQGSILVMLLYSITALPTLYYSLMYLIFSVFSYALLPKKILRQYRYK